MWDQSFITYHLAYTETSRIPPEKGDSTPFLSFAVLLTVKLSYPQLSRCAIERSALKRVDYVVKIATEYQLYQLVFVDESACDRRTTYRGHAWPIVGHRAVRKAFFVG